MLFRGAHIKKTRVCAYKKNSVSRVFLKIGPRSARFRPRDPSQSIRLEIPVRTVVVASKNSLVGPLSGHFCECMKNLRLRI